MQEKRLINLRNRKICFINHELGEHFLINEKDINDKETINAYYLLAKEVFNKKCVRKKLLLLNKTLRIYNSLQSLIIIKIYLIEKLIKFILIFVTFFLLNLSKI